jgi:hypothetical protein
VAEIWLKEIGVPAMPRKQMPVTGIPKDFTLTETTLIYITTTFPTVNVEKTMERFVDSALAHGRMYADWQAAFRTWVRKAIENKWDGVEFKKGIEQDPRWTPILSEVAPYGFRKPMPHETPGSYRTEFNLWKGKQNRAPVIQFGDVLKRMG